MGKELSKRGSSGRLRYAELLVGIVSSIIAATSAYFSFSAASSVQRIEEARFAQEVSGYPAALFLVDSGPSLYSRIEPRENASPLNPNLFIDNQMTIGIKSETPVSIGDVRAAIWMREEGKDDDSREDHSSSSDYKIHLASDTVRLGAFFFKRSAGDNFGRVPYDGSSLVIGQTLVLQDFQVSSEAIYIAVRNSDSDYWKEIEKRCPFMTVSIDYTADSGVIRTETFAAKLQYDTYSPLIPVAKGNSSLPTETDKHLIDITGGRRSIYTANSGKRRLFGCDKALSSFINATNITHAEDGS